MLTFDTANLSPVSAAAQDSDQTANLYNGLDCCVTFEVYQRLMEELEDSPQNVKDTYAFSMAKQAPYLEMSMRGIKIDFVARDKTVALLEEQTALLSSRFERICKEVFGAPVKWSSPLQLKNLFYGCLGLKEIKQRNAKGEYTTTVNEEALNKLCQNFWAQPLALYVLALREMQKKLGFLRTGVDPDGRIRCNLNVAGTNTGRLSSSLSDFGTGTNLQNVDTALREVFVADEGMILVNVDLEQADARNVGAMLHNIFYGDPRASDYLDMCESGDLHTRVCRMVWPGLRWGDDPKAWRAVADQIVYRAFSYRDTAKRIGHGTNYMGTALTVAKRTHTDFNFVKTFQENYFTAFSLIPEWHNWVINEIKQFQMLTTLFGRRRMFFGRPDDSETWRKAVAYGGQSMTGHEIDKGVVQLWRASRTASPGKYSLQNIQFLMQVHDSILFQVPFDGCAQYVSQAMELMKFIFMLKGDRPFSVPLEAKVGWNWGNRTDDEKTGLSVNPFGLLKWKGSEDRAPPKKMSRLNARLDK